ncbi:hypothetical protein MHU86_282 [Fragilaria crotonensis]|nr:hypothetical protein MHU86_17896 [Fragilaria crotonensis]KAI2514389.1 hypothetical protein MHU86_282 [Fragilaria crotonensis]
MNEHHTQSIRKRSHLFSSPEKERCYSCGREVKAGQMSRHFSHYPQCSVDIEGSRKRPATNHARRRKRRKRLEDTTADPKDIDSDGVDSDHHPRQLHHRSSSRRSIFPVSRNDSHSLTITPEQRGEVNDFGTASENPCDDFPVLDDEATPTVLGEVHQEDAPDSSIREFETASSAEESEDKDAPTLPCW